MKHTPGPWIAQDRDVFHGTLVASAQYNPDNRSIVEQRANAYLIAAAPDLLAALKEVALLINAGSMDHFHGEPWIDHVRAAIDKAEPQATCTQCGDSCSFDQDSGIWRHHTGRQHAAKAEPQGSQS